MTDIFGSLTISLAKQETQNIKCSECGGVVLAMDIGNGTINPGEYDKPHAISRSDKEDMISMLQKQIDKIKSSL